jgi:hypothetical protein
MPILNSRTSLLAAGALLSLTLLGAGCGGSTNRTIDPETNTINLQGEGGSNLSAGEGAQIPTNFPASYPRYPGAKTILAYTEANGTSGTLVQETSAPLAQVQASVETSMQAQGFTKDNTLTSPDVVILSFSKGTTRCQVNVAAQNGTTHIQSTCAERTN